MGSVIEHLDGLLAPSLPILTELADELTIFGVNADHGQLLGLIISTLLIDVEELSVSALAIGWFTRGRFDAFSILSQGVAAGFEETAVYDRGFASRCAVFGESARSHPGSRSFANRH